MAKPVRSVWVYKRPKKYGNLPFSEPSRKPFDYEARLATPEHFPDKSPIKSPMWVFWLHGGTNRKLGRQPFWIKNDLQAIFGSTFPELKKLHVCKNTPYYNSILWRLKHLIDVKPLTFPNGEPTEADIADVQIRYTGECLINKSLMKGLKVGPDLDFEKRELSVRDMMVTLGRRWSRCQEMNEDNLWNDPDHSKI